MSALTDELDKATPQERQTLKVMTALRLGLLDEITRDVENLRGKVGDLPGPAAPAGQSIGRDAAWSLIESKGYRRGVDAAFASFKMLLELSAEISREVLAELKR